MAMQETTKDLIKQAQMDALCGKIIHAKRLSRLRKATSAVDVFVIVVPILFFAPRLMAGAGYIKDIVESANVILSVTLLSLGVIKQVRRWEDRARLHIKYLSENIMIKNEADHLLRKNEATDGEGMAFLRLAEAVEKPDSEILADASATEKQFAYREALKELVQNDPRCHQCGANPWAFKKGQCQMCGGTPPQECKGA